MATEVKVKFTADGSMVNRTVGQIQSKIGSFASSIKTQLLAAFSVATVGMIAKNIIDFGDEIKGMAAKFQITTESAQRFRWAARHAGIEVGALTRGINLLDIALDKAKGGTLSAEGLQALNALGLTGDYINKAIPADKALLDMLKNTQNMSNQALSSYLQQIGMPISIAKQISSAREELLSGNIPLVSDESINKLADLGNVLTDLKEVLLTAVIPVLLEFAKILLQGTRNFITTFQAHEAFVAGALEHSPDPGLFERFAGLTWATLGAGGLTLFDAAETLYEFIPGVRTEDYIKRRKEYYSSMKRGLYDNMYKNLYGEAGFKAGMENISANTNKDGVLSNLFTIVDDLLKKWNNPKKKEEVILEREGIKKEIVAKKTMLPSLPTNEFIKIGNMLGVDAQYRIERLTIKMLEYQKQTAENTAAMARALSTPDLQDFP